MQRNEATIGTRVRSLRNFSGVPKGTEGVIDEDYGSGVMVAWDLPNRPLPKGWKEFNRGEFQKIMGNPIARNKWPLRDGFSKDELEMLEVATNELQQIQDKGLENNMEARIRTLPSAEEVVNDLSQSK